MVFPLLRGGTRHRDTLVLCELVHSLNPRATREDRAGLLALVPVFEDIGEHGLHVLLVVDSVVVADNVADASSVSLEKPSQGLLGVVHDFIPVFVVVHFGSSFSVVLAY